MYHRTTTGLTVNFQSFNGSDMQTAAEWEMQTAQHTGLRLVHPSQAKQVVILGNRARKPKSSTKWP